MKNLLLFSIGLLLFLSCSEKKGATPIEIPPVETWTKLTDFPGEPRFDAISFSIGDLFFVGTGQSYNGYCQDLWAFDTNTKIWSQKADLPGGSRTGSVAFSIGSKGYVGLGFRRNFSQSNSYIYYKDFYSFDAQANTWSPIAEFKGAGGYQNGAFVINNKAYVLSSKEWYSFETWEFDPLLNSWTQKSSCTATGVNRMVTFAINGKGYAGTGWNGSKNSGELWEYNPDNDTWTKKAPFPGAARAEAIGFSIGNKGYIGGGESYESSSGPNKPVTKFNDLYSYSPVSDSWSRVDSLKNNNYISMIANAVNGKAFIGTGFKNPNIFSNEFWSFKPVN